MPGIGDGQQAVQFSGDNTYIRQGGVAFDAVWNGATGSVVSWQRVDGAARWTDSTTYRWVWHVRSSTDVTYYIATGKSSGDNQLSWRRRTGSAPTEILYTFPDGGPLGWFGMGMTWDENVPEIRAFACGAYIGQKSDDVTAWGDHPVLSDNICVLYAGTVTLQEWIGRGAHCIYWNHVLSDQTMCQLTKL